MIYMLLKTWMSLIKLNIGSSGIFVNNKTNGLWLKKATRYTGRRKSKQAWRKYLKRSLQKNLKQTKLIETGERINLNVKWPPTPAVSPALITADHITVIMEEAADATGNAVLHHFLLLAHRRHLPLLRHLHTTIDLWHCWGRRGLGWCRGEGWWCTIVVVLTRQRKHQIFITEHKNRPQLHSLNTPTAYQPPPPHW